MKGANKSYLTAHMKVHDPNYKPPSSKHICELCGKVFKDKGKLEDHKMSHLGPESWKFACEICGKKCLTKQKLDEHQRTHTKEKPFVCQICGVAYAHRHNLRLHVNSKHGSEVEDKPRKFVKVNTEYFTKRKAIMKKDRKEIDMVMEKDDKMCFEDTSKS